MSRVQRFNRRLAIGITNAVGTMWCAYGFALIALVGLPAVLGWNIIPGRAASLVLWVSSEFLQLVLLSVIMVGQNVQASKTDDLVEHQKRTHRLVDELHHRHHLGGTGTTSVEVVGPSGEGA